MSNPPKQKGTGFETEFVNDATAAGLRAVRTSAGAKYDVRITGSTGRVIAAIATRPDRGSTLVTIPMKDFFHLLANHGDNAIVECKRYKRFALHTIFNQKFGEYRGR